MFSSDFVKFINTADAPVSQDQGSSLQGKSPTDRVSDDGGCQACTAGGGATHIQPSWCSAGCSLHRVHAQVVYAEGRGGKVNEGKHDCIGMPFHREKPQQLRRLSQSYQ